MTLFCLRWSQLYANIFFIILLVRQGEHMSNRFPLAVALVLMSVCAARPCAAQAPGTFSAAINYSAGPPLIPSNTGYLFGGIGAFDPHVGDFNGDGKLDLIVGASCAGTSLPTCPSTSGYGIAVYLA